MVTRYRFLSSFALSLGLLMTGAQRDVHSTPRPEQTAFGSLTGAITNEQHQAIHNAQALLASGVVITAEAQENAGIRNPDAFGRGIFGTGETTGRRTASDLNAGGLYTLDKLKPGVYNLTVEAGELNAKPYRPQRIMGVVIKPGQQTTLDITLHPGERLEEVGEPTVAAHKNLQFGCLEGTVVTAEGKALHSASALLATGVTIVVSNASGKLGAFKSDHMAGGFFSIQNFHAGTYTFLVEASEIPGPVRYHPVQIRNVVIKPGVRTVLNIVPPAGTELERIDAQPKIQPFKLP